MTTTEALKLALDALDEFCELGAIIRPLEVRDALREALAETEQEPEHRVSSNSRYSPLLTHMMNERVKSNVKQVIELYDSPDQPAPATELREQEPVAWLQIGLPPLHGGDVIARTTKPTKWNPEWWRFEPLYTTPPQRKPLPPQSPCEMTQAEGKMFRLGWLECEAAHGITGEKK